ncbi:MAG: osmoprotectant NAGGN system M42 family peptidase [Rhodospirillaceae bacterium]
MTKAKKTVLAAPASDVKVDMDFLLATLRSLLDIPSPSGFTDNIVHFTCGVLSDLGIEYELTRRGAIRATLPGIEGSPDRAVVSHVDTLGAMVKNLKTNGRLDVAPIGTWSSRFAEGARVTIYTDEGPRRGTILPLKASGHTYNKEIDTQPVSWQNLEIRVDEKTANLNDLIAHGFSVGDFVSIDPLPEFTESGFISSRHLDNKAGVAAMLAAAKAVVENGDILPVECHLIFTIAEEIGVGASGTLHGDIAEMVSVDNGTLAPGQNTSEFGVTIAAMDSAGPFDYHLVKYLIELCRKNEIPFSRDVFNYYRSDAASALESGNDVRTCLVCFGLDASHGYERVHRDSLNHLSRLLTAYMKSERILRRDRKDLGSIEDFPRQPEDEH